MNQQIDNNFIIEQNKIYYSENAHIYEMFSRGQNHRIKVHLQQKIASIKGGFSDFVRVLDIGAGTGFAIKTVASMFHDFRVQFVGCDISPAMLKVAKTQTGLADFVLFNGVSLPFSDRSFDIVLLVSVLHHLLDPVPLLNEAMRVLSNRGSIIILQEPNPLVNGPSRRIKRLMKALPDEKLMLAEYHQFMTDGLYPEIILNLLYENSLECKIEYTNAALIDALCTRFGRGIDWFLSPLGLLHNKFLCLNYSIIAASNQRK